MSRFLNEQAGLVNRLDSEEDFDAVKWLLEEPIVNFSQSIVDDSIKENAAFHAEAGLTPQVVRKESGDCCEWCREVVGVYTYPKVPKDVYRRHQRCRCTVDYDPKDGKKQNIWSRKWSKTPQDEVERRRQLHKDIRENNRKSDSAEYKKIVETLRVEKSPISLAKFQDLKYNDVERYTWLKRDERFYKELESKDWNDAFKEKSRQSI